MGNMRAFFDEYATEKGFDPLSVEAWYSISLLDLQSKKVGGSQFSLNSPPPPFLLTHPNNPL